MSANLILFTIMHTKKPFKFPIKDIIVPIFKQHRSKTYKRNFPGTAGTIYRP